MKIIAGSTHYDLATKIADLLNVSLITPSISRFDDGEFRAQITDDIKSDDVYIIQSTCEPVNDNLIELLLLIDTARCAKANKIAVVIPYFGYSRQDRSTYNYGPLSARLVVSLMQNAGAHEVILIDIHSSSIFENSMLLNYNLSPSSLFAKFISSSSVLIVGPDAGSAERVQRLSLHTKCDFVIFDKVKILSDCTISSRALPIEGRDCILVDDIISTGNTICKAAAYLYSCGAASVRAFVTHIMSRDASNYVAQNSAIESIYVTDTIVHKNLHSRFHVLSIDKLVTNAIDQHVRESKVK